MTLLTPNARCSINTQWAPNSLCNPLACASSDLVLVEALGGRRQGHADHAALRLACLRPPTSSAWLHFEIDADADQCSNDRHAANCVPRGAGGARAVQARQGVGGRRARGLDCKGYGLLTRAADDGPNRARVGAGFDFGRVSIERGFCGGRRACDRRRGGSGWWAGRLLPGPCCHVPGAPVPAPGRRARHAFI